MPSPPLPQHLFSLLTIDSMTPPGRIAMAPHGVVFPRSHGSGVESVIDYHAERAKGGVDVIVMSNFRRLPSFSELASWGDNLKATPLGNLDMVNDTATVAACRSLARQGLRMCSHTLMLSVAPGNVLCRAHFTCLYWGGTALTRRRRPLATRLSTRFTASCRAGMSICMSSSMASGWVKCSRRGSAGLNADLVDPNVWIVPFRKGERNGAVNAED